MAQAGDIASAMETVQRFDYHWLLPWTLKEIAIEVAKTGEFVKAVRIAGLIYPVGNYGDPSVLIICVNDITKRHGIGLALAVRTVQSLLGAVWQIAHTRFIRLSPVGDYCASHQHSHHTYSNSDRNSLPFGKESVTFTDNI